MFRVQSATFATVPHPHLGTIDAILEAANRENEIIAVDLREARRARDPPAPTTAVVGGPADAAAFAFEHESPTGRCSLRRWRVRRCRDPASIVTRRFKHLLAEGLVVAHALVGTVG